MKPYHAIAIHDCGEPLVPIPLDHFAWVDPHPYQALGAPYGDSSPYALRQGVLLALYKAQGILQKHYAHWKIQIFDAFRPVKVQKFMVNHTFEALRRLEYPQADQLTSAQRSALMAEVVQFWALPSDDPATPPPHSTGAALDVTLVNEKGEPIDMGSPIDEVSPRSFPDHFVSSQEPQAQQCHANRTLLHQVMQSAGFRRHPQEWWHFSLGDQLWAWLVQQETGLSQPLARYGGVHCGP